MTASLGKYYLSDAHNFTWEPPLPDWMPEVLFFEKRNEYIGSVEIRMIDLPKNLEDAYKTYLALCLNDTDIQLEFNVNENLFGQLRPL